MRKVYLVLFSLLVWMSLWSQELTIYQGYYLSLEGEVIGVNDGINEEDIILMVFLDVNYDILEVQIYRPFIDKHISVFFTLDDIVSQKKIKIDNLEGDEDYGLEMYFIDNITIAISNMNKTDEIDKYRYYLDFDFLSYISKKGTVYER